MLKVLSHGMLKLENLHLFLKEEEELFSDPVKIEAVAGWGYKETAVKARELAKKENVPYIAVEDGFLRSLDLGVNGGEALSLSVDPFGCYYDASTSSLIEELLKDRGWFDEKVKQRAQKCIARIKELNLSKYNAAPLFDEKLLNFNEKHRVLIIDQCLNDASLLLGKAPNDVMSRMIKKAREIYPDSSLYIKVHPDVIAGKRQSLCNLNTISSDVKVISQNAAPYSLLKHFDVVFTATSLLGFEALLSECDVYCFGMPFYAGYGLTHDDLTNLRRTDIVNAFGKVSLELLFAAVYFKLCRYINPVTKKRTEIEDVIERLALLKTINDKNRGNHVVYGVKNWKKPILQAFLHSTDGKIVFTRNKAKVITLAQNLQADVIQWAAKADRALEKQCKANGIKTCLVEDGFLRSVGLGSNHVKPFSLIFDDKGMYFDPTRDSLLEDILNTIHANPQIESLQRRAADIIDFMCRKSLTKYNLHGKNDVEVTTKLKNISKYKILIPGQVPSDASVSLAGGSIHNNVELVKAVRKDNPDAFLIYKVHPDVLALNRKGIRNESECSDYVDFTVTDCSIGPLYDLVDEVCVLSSQSGFEALLRSKKVSVYGAPFYAGWGLTYDKAKLPRRNAKLSLLDLVAGTLILYPRYFDWCSGQFCSVEDICYRLLHMEKMPEDSLFVKVCRVLYALRRKTFNYLAKD